MMDKILEYKEVNKEYTIIISVNMHDNLQYESPELRKSIKLALNVIAKCFHIKTNEKRKGVK